jgi:hypothetical protein
LAGQGSPGGPMCCPHAGGEKQGGNREKGGNVTEESSPLSAVSSKELKRRIEESLAAQSFVRGQWVQLVEGRNDLRLLGLYREVRVHYLRVREEGEFVSRRFHCPGEGCPACLRAERAKEQGRAAQARRYGAKPRYLWLCMDLRDSEHVDGSLKVKLFEHGPALLAELKMAQEDVEAGISDLKEGRVVIVKKLQRGRRPRDVCYLVRLGEPMPMAREEMAAAELPDLEAACAPTPVAEMEEALGASGQGDGEEGAGRSGVHGILKELRIGHGQGEMDARGSGGVAGEGGADRLRGLRRVPPFLGEKAEEAAPWPGPCGEC